MKWLNGFLERHMHRSLQVNPATVSESPPAVASCASSSSSELCALPAAQAGGGQTSTERPALIDSQRPGLTAPLHDVSLNSSVIALACHASQSRFSCYEHHSSMEASQAAGSLWLMVCMCTASRMLSWQLPNRSLQLAWQPTKTFKG